MKTDKNKTNNKRCGICKIKISASSRSNLCARCLQGGK